MRQGFFGKGEGEKKKEGGKKLPALDPGLNKTPLESLRKLRGIGEEMAEFLEKEPGGL